MKEKVENMKAISVKLTLEEIAAIDEIGQRKYRVKKNRSQVIRLLVEDAGKEKG